MEKKPSAEAVLLSLRAYERNWAPGPATADERSKAVGVIIPISLPCPECLTAWESALNARPDFRGDAAFHCQHSGVAIHLSHVDVRAGHVGGFNIYSCADREQFERTEAMSTGVALGLEAALAEQIAQERAAGGTEH